MLRLSYLNFFPGNHFNLHSVYISYDSYFPALNGGAGFYLANDYLGGIINDIRGGLSYAYFFQAGKNLYINAGLSAALYHRGFNFNGAILPDQIDPLGTVTAPSGEILTNEGRTIFDVGTGFLFISGRFFGGFSISHLAEPVLSHAGSLSDKLNRKLQLHLAGDFNLNGKSDFRIRPLVTAGFQKDFISGGIGAVVESNYLSVNAVLLTDNKMKMDIHTGFSLKRGRLMIFYNYTFNIKSGNLLLPTALMHQTGAGLSLNNVEKRRGAGTINLPEL